MTDSTKGTVSGLIEDVLAGRASRRAILRRSAALGVAAPMVAAMLKVTESGVAAQPTGEEIVIGCPYNLTGTYASLDNPAKNGSELAAKLLNASNGILGRPVRLVVDDGKSDTATVSNVAKKMIEEDKVVALAGLTDTDYVRAAGSVAQQAQLPFIDVGGTAPIIESIGDFVFMVPFGDNVQAAAGAEFAQERGWTSAAMLVDDSTSYTKFLAQYFKTRYSDDEIKGQVVKELSYKTGDTDFSSQLTEIKNLNPAPSVLFISSGPAEIGTIVKQARDLGIELPILGGDGYDTPQLIELAGDASRNVFFTTHQGIYGDAPEAASFKEQYKTEYNTDPESVFAALGFDGINLMADAMTRAGSTDGTAVRDALATTQGFKGATGEISYEPGKRIPSKSVALIEVKDRTFNLLNIVVPRTVPPA
jgi:branched-chain amino acid transport system substrate-binding protein